MCLASPDTASDEAPEHALNQDHEQDRDDQDSRGDSCHYTDGQAPGRPRFRQLAGLAAGLCNNRWAGMSRQRGKTLDDWHQLAETLGREQLIQARLIVLLLQLPCGVGSIKPGVQPITFGIGDRSIGFAPIGRGNRQITAHPVQATRRMC